MKHVHDRINEILPSTKSTDILVAFDIDMTLTQPIESAMYYPIIHKYAATYKKILRSEPPEQQDLMLSLIVQYPQQLVETDTPAIIKSLQEKGLKTIAFTNSATGSIKTKNSVIDLIENVRYNVLNSFGINFSNTFKVEKIVFNNLPLYRGNHPVFYRGILLANGENGQHSGKGKVLIEFLKHVGLEPKVVVMVDDKRKNLEDISKYLQQHDPQIEFFGIEYEAAKYYIPKEISEDEFKKFWLELANQAKEQPTY